jgi:hypothetical protein
MDRVTKEGWISRVRHSEQFEEENFRKRNSSGRSYAKHHYKSRALN